MKFAQLLSTALVVLFLSSCIIQHPAYTKVEKVLTLQVGQSKEEVNKILGIPPYDIKSRSDSGEVLIYKYRVTDRKTVPFVVKPNNGLKTNGKYVDLFIAFSKEGKVTGIETCSTCEETNEKEQRIDINKVITLITVTLPAVMIYLGLQNP